nr:protein-glutamate O-methyltransferase CheR [Tissierella sp.]
MTRNEIKENIQNEDIEIHLLLEVMLLKYGYDFKNYSKAHIKRRILRRVEMLGLNSVTELQYKILHDESIFKMLLADFSINVTEMFRDPSFYKAFRTEVVPVLKTYPFIKIWHAGCSTGEEVYSMAILLKEEGLYDRTQIYATDFNELVLQKAKAGIYNIDAIKTYTKNYQLSGGRASFGDYYTAKYDSVILDESLKQKIIFADHNLVTDGVFGEMHVIICRNVIIYFNKDLKDKTLDLFYKSLNNGCFLCLGSKEGIKFSSSQDKFIKYVSNENIFQRKFTLD